MVADVSTKMSYLAKALGYDQSAQKWSSKRRPVDFD